jgi:hypothetical protein
MKSKFVVPAQFDLELTSQIRGVDYHCLNEPADLLAASAVSIVQDFIVCGMPTVLFWKLQLPRRQKIALGAVFGVGFLYVIHSLQMVVCHKQKLIFWP